MKYVAKAVSMMPLLVVTVGLSLAVLDPADAMSLFGGGGSHSSGPRQTLRQNTASSPSNTNDGLLSITAKPVTVTPEPATVMLFGSGLLSLMLWRLKKRP